MSHSAPPIPLEGLDCRLGTHGPAMVKAGFTVAAIGLTVAVLAALVGGDQLVRFAHAYLVAYLFSLSILLGALLFVLFQHLTGAGWATSIRRVPEILGGLLPLWCLLGLPILFFMPFLYPWATGYEMAGNDPAKAFKTMMLQPGFFIVRLIIYFVAWSLIGWIYFRRSVQQDHAGGVETTIFLQRMSPAATIICALTMTMFSFDVIMSLDPVWHSTMFGIYYFSGCMVGSIAAIILLVRFLDRNGFLEGVITVHHYHDLGKFLFAFNMFWAYIAFSQYMLIWYANIPEETVWYAVRLHGSWAWVGWLLLFGHFVIPFVGLISRGAKRRRNVLAFWAAWLLVMHFVDMWWLVIPPISVGQMSFTLIDAGLAVGLSGLLVGSFAVAARRISLVSSKDPRLTEALAHVSP